VTRAQQVLKSDQTGAEKVARLVFHHLAPMVERLDYTLVFLRERRFLPQPARKRIRAIEVRYERIIQRIVEQAIASGEFRADLDARLATLALLGLGNSAALWLGREPGVTIERITQNYVELLVRAFRIRH
jgi:AcrR family transcriptional regulator